MSAHPTHCRGIDAHHHLFFRQSVHVIPIATTVPSHVPSLPQHAIHRTIPHAQFSSFSASASSPQPPPPTPPRRALGVDYGRKYIGLAVSTFGLAPRPLPNMKGGGLEELMVMAQEIVDTAVLQGCDCIVIGLPVTTTGSLRKRTSDSQQGRKCRNFADSVSAVGCTKGIQVYLVDERGTTMEAEALVGALGGGRAEQKRKKDAVAAALILSSFFADIDSAMYVRPPRVVRKIINSTGGSTSLQQRPDA